MLIPAQPFLDKLPCSVNDLGSCFAGNLATVGELMLRNSDESRL